MCTRHGHTAYARRSCASHSHTNPPENPKTLRCAICVVCVCVSSQRTFVCVRDKLSDNKTVRLRQDEERMAVVALARRVRK